MKPMKSMKKQLVLSNHDFMSFMPFTVCRSS